MLNNYKQALSIISDYTPIVEGFKNAHGYTDEDFETWQVQELAFLERASREPEADVRKVAYVEALQRLAKMKYVTVPLPSSFKKH